MAKQPFFSIIIPTLNEAKYLPKLLEDLSNQTYNDFEVIIVDGGSKDKTLSLAEAYRARLPYLNILKSTRAHVCTQRNQGATNAKANILIFSDADNRLPHYFLQGIKYRWEKEATHMLLPFITPNPVTPNNRVIATGMNLFIDFQMTVKPKYLLESCFVIDRSVFIKIGMFDESINYSEGSSLLTNFTKYHYHAKVIRDPTYQFSFRRMQKYGTTKVIGDVVALQLSDLLGIDQKQLDLSKLYPMLGGKAYTNKYQVQKTKIASFLNKITKLLKEF